jgi:hypothetical protein
MAVNRCERAPPTRSRRAHPCGAAVDRYRGDVGFNPYRGRVKRRSDIVLVAVALVVVAILVAWAAIPR